MDSSGPNVNQERKRKLYKISTMAGIMIVLLPNGVPMFWGNLAAYVNSYIVVCLDSVFGVEEPWVVSIVILFFNISAVIYGPIRDRLGKHCTAILCIALVDIGYLTSYYSVQTSFALLNITIALIPGIAAGVLYAHCLHLVIDWADNDAGLLLSVVQGSFYWGSAIITQIVTMYLNPDNVKPEIRIENSVYFSQTDILDKVPSLFLVLGGFAVGCHVIGYLLIRDNTFDKAVCVTPTCENTAVKEVKENGYHSVEDKSRDGVETGRQAKEERNSTGSGYTPREMIKSGSFYALWTVYFFVELPLILLTNYYKSFGQIWIHDDHFLADLGTVLSFANIVNSFVWGFAMDKIGGRNSLILLLISTILLSLWYYFTAIVDKWLYFVITNFFSAHTGVLFNSIAFNAVALFGKTHFNTNYGLLRTSAIVLCIACPFIAKAFLQNFGWFYLFAINGFTNIFGLALMLFYVPRF